MNASLFTVLVAVLAALAPDGLPPGDGAGAWPQWGGPHRNFITDAPGLALTWPEGGPHRLWQRPLGDGFSAIVTDGSTLYTLYRDGERDVVVALSAATGATIWESRYAAPFRETCSQQLGPAPRAAPLIAGDRLITISAGGLMHAFDRRTGAKLWQVDLLDGAAETVRACGYASSPIAYKRLILTTAGGTGRGVIAVDAATGTTVWQSLDVQNGYSSPILIDLDGRPELVVFTYGEVAGLDPDTGALEWSHPHPSDQGVNVATPIWGDDRLLFVSSAYNGGSRALRLSRGSGRVTVEEVWANRRVRIHFGNAVRFGRRIYASNGDFGAAPLAAVDVTTGETSWRDRSLARSTIVGASGRLVLLDEDGNLAIATPGETGLTIHARAPILGTQSWTVPTLSGTRLFVRDRRQIVAVDLGNPAKGVGKRQQAGGSAGLSPQPLDQLNLARVIDVVRGDAGNEREDGDGSAGRGALEIARRQAAHGRAQLAMHPIQQRDILLPERCVPAIGPREPVRAFQRKRAAALAGEPPPHGVLPVGRVDEDLPDIVAAGCRAPRGLSGRHPA